MQRIEELKQMQLTEDDLLKFDAELMGNVETLIIHIAEDKPVHKSRLQRICLIYDELYGIEDIENHVTYFTAGYSDDVDEFAENLVSLGVLLDDKNGYLLSDYGRKLKHLLDAKDMEQRVNSIKKSLSKTSDRNVTALTHHFYESVAVNSAIKSSVARLNEKMRLNGIPLCDAKKDDFEGYMKHGIPICIEIAV